VGGVPWARRGSVRPRALASSYQDLRARLAPTTVLVGVSTATDLFDLLPPRLGGFVYGGNAERDYFDLDDEGAVAKETLVVTDKDGPIQSVDGLCVDQGENLYLCTGGGGVRMYGPAGDFLGSIDVPGATDCTFGGADMKTLFVGTSGSVAGDKNLYQVPMNIPGLP